MENTVHIIMQYLISYDTEDSFICVISTFEYIIFAWILLLLIDGKKRLLIYCNQTQLMIVEENVKYM